MTKFRFSRFLIIGIAIVFFGIIYFGCSQTDEKEETTTTVDVTTTTSTVLATSTTLEATTTNSIDLATTTTENQVGTTSSIMDSITTTSLSSVTTNGQITTTTNLEVTTTTELTTTTEQITTTTELITTTSTTVEPTTTTTTTTIPQTPKIVVKQGGVEIPYNGTFDFGKVYLSKTLEFTIKNIGSQPLMLTGQSPNYITTTGDVEFTISSQPTSYILLTDIETTFKVTYSQKTIGLNNNGIILIMCNDPEINDVFMYKVSGTSITLSDFSYFMCDGNNNTDILNSIIIDSNNNVYVAGHGTNIVNSSSGYDWWIKKFSSDGIEDTTNWDKKIDHNNDFVFIKRSY